MDDEGWFQLVGPQRAVQIVGVRLVGVNAENGKKLLVTLAFIAALFFVTKLARGLVTRALQQPRRERAAFWTRQSIMLAATVVLVVGIASIWFDDPTRLTTALGLVTAGLAFALQRVVTALAGYFIILRGKTFNVGDRIVMGGVRGDVIALGFTQTTIMEMGQPPPVQGAPPAMWVRSREYTGRLVTVSNAKIFDEAVYNYTRELPYIFEEISVPIRFDADHARAEAILLDAANRHTADVATLGEEAMREMERKYAVKHAEMRPRVYFRLTDDWVELTVRFVVPDNGIRAVKDAMTRHILRDFREAGIEVASTTIALAGVPRSLGATPWAQMSS